MPIRQITVSALLFAAMLIAAYYLDQRMADRSEIELREVEPSGYAAKTTSSGGGSVPFSPREYVRIVK
ncbi:hypothetical protein [Cohnella hongkongensis]|uniref:Uncharacterized protein n=1 Tax=Cohnella hongkongensis TaxID=178337 RepID=A0ABV9F865_9BACL